jgi:hypothetical protein
VRCWFRCTAIAACSLVAGCAGAAPAGAKTDAFYAWNSLGPESRSPHERRYPPLDTSPPGSLARIGVEVLQGGARLARPADWVVRSASSEPGRRFVQYSSPRAFLFVVAEWPARPDAPWGEVLSAFESQARASHAELLGSRIPVATHDGQGRAYWLRRKTAAPESPQANLSREILVRGEHRSLLVQVVHSEDSDLAHLSGEVLPVIQSLRLSSPPGR